MIPPVVLSRSSQSLFALLVTLACLTMAGCGIVANNKAIPGGTPTATMHFGPLHSGMMVQSINLHDGPSCRGQQFARFKTIGAYLGRDLDMDVPAGGELFFSLTNSESIPCSRGICYFRCGGEASFMPQPGEHYTATLRLDGKGCQILMTRKRGSEDVPVETRPAPPC